MHINFFNNSNTKSKQTFKARLFDQNGQQIKAFDLQSCLKNIDVMSKRGGQKTDIFVKEFISEDAGYAGYDNYVRLTLSNPLFGEQSFVQNLHHTTNNPVKGDTGNELYHMDLLTGIQTNNCKNLENKAFRMSLLKKIQKAAAQKDTENMNPVNIVNNMLSKIPPKEHGFSAERLSDFRTVAQDMLEQILYKGIEQIKK